VAFFRFAEGENVAIVTEDGMVSINQLDYQPPATTLGTSVKGTITKPKRQRTKMLFSVQKEISCARVKASSTPMVCVCVCVQSALTTRISCLRASSHEHFCLLPPQNSLVAVGGKDYLLELWNIELSKSMFKSEVVFKGKNVPHNKLDMQEPIWLKDIHFLQSDGSADNGTAPGHVLVTSTAYSHIQIYDTRAQQRPVQSKHVKELEHPINCIQPTKDEKQLYVGDSAGTLCRLDIRKNFELSGRFVGPVGSIRDMSLHPTMPMIASGGFDRNLNVWDTNTRKKVLVAHLKQRVTNVIFSPSGENNDFKGSTGGDKKNVSEGDDDSDLEAEELQGLDVDETAVDGEEDEDDEDDEEVCLADKKKHVYFWGGEKIYLPCPSHFFHH
jgi:WD40 repeat protein